LTVPAEPAGAVAVIVVELLTVNPVAFVAPNFTAVTFVKSVPVIVTDVPAVSGPAVGLSAVTVGAATYVYWSAADVVDVPSAFVTVTSTVPAACAGAVAVIDVAEFTTTVSAEVPPNDTDEVVVKFVPVMVTEVEPLVGPTVGLIDVTVGSAVSE
jgi:hypothetical protein